MVKKIIIYIFLILIITGCITSKKVNNVIESKKEIKNVSQFKLKLFSEPKGNILNNFKKEIYILPELSSKDYVYITGYNIDGAYLSVHKGNSDITNYLYFNFKTKKLSNIYNQDFSKIAVSLNQLLYDQENIYINEMYTNKKGKLDLKIFKVNRNAELTKICSIKDLWGLPALSLIGNNIIVNYTLNQNNKILDKLISIDKDTKDIFEIASSEATIDENGLYTGKSIIECDGINNGLYYQIIETNKSNMSEGEGVSKVYYYSLKDKKITKEIKFNILLDYLTGTEDYLITSDYLPRDPNKKGGRIFDFKNGNYQYVPGIDAVNQIKKVYQLTEGVLLLVAIDNYYIYDLNKKLFYKANTQSEVCAYKNSFGYCEQNNNKIHLVIYKNVKLIK